MLNQEYLEIQPLPANTSREEFCSALLSRMTLAEKIGQMVQADLSWKQDIKQLLLEGRIGSLLSIQDPKVINEHQHITVERSRLGIPLLIGNDIIHGYRSIFPIPLALASSWNPGLIEEVARMAIAEGVATGTTWNYAPMVDICRDPRWGRIAEGAGEDPLLVSRVGAAWTRGFQNYHDQDGRRASACVKHFAAYGAAESGKDYNTTDMSERRLREEYLPPYKAAIDAGAKTIMTSFNDLNGLPATANPFLLKTILRKEWGFDGVIVSDYDSIGELVLHGFAKDAKEAARRSILASVDIDMMGNAYHFHLADLVHEGKVPATLIDEAVMRILKLKFDLGLFEHPYLDENRIAASIMQPEALDLAQKAAAESIVLLKNDQNLLPLTPGYKNIALIGPMANERQSLLGCWRFAGQMEETETIREALQRYLPPGSNLLVDNGCSIDGEETNFESAKNIASQADIVILALGESDGMSGEAHSRAHLGLPGSQQELMEAVAAIGKPCITAVFAGRPILLSKVTQLSQSLLMVWHGGSRSAAALCDVLFGRVNPSAKLPVSFPRSEGQIPVYYAHKLTGRPIESEGTLQFNQAHKSSYLDESNSPLFPFGYGLSFSQFKYDNLQVHTKSVKRYENIKVSAVVTNVGKMEGSEVVQCYVQDLVGMVTRPAKELKDFQRINLSAGESRLVEFTLPVEKLAFLDPELHPIVEPGEFKIWIATNSTEGLEGQFEVVD